MTGPVGPLSDNQSRKSQQSSGSQEPELRYLAIGRIVRSHGLQGEVSVTVLTEFPERFAETEWVYLGDEFEATAYQLKAHRWHKQNVLLTLNGVTDRDQADMLKGQLVQVPIEDAMPLPDGTYYLYQLIDLEIITTTGERLGVITDIIEIGAANDVYVVKNEDKEILIPAIGDVVKSIDMDKGQMVIEVIDGLI